ncbi:unnamed protein product, partial [Didymodactylos carnosus]
EVWLVNPLSPNHKPAKQYVLKRMSLRQQTSEQAELEGAEREAKLLSSLNHPNIVSYTESFRSHDGFLNIVMNYCEGGDVYTKLKERKQKKLGLLDEEQIAEWFIQVCMAIQYIHERNILHRDLKTQNIFLTKNNIVKVGDLGIARILDNVNELATTIIGTPPEIFSNKPYGQKSDVWSLGCCIYEMTTLEHAFNANDINSLVIKIIRGQTPETSKDYSKPLTNLIELMLKKDPSERPTVKQILQSQYMKQNIIRLLDKTRQKQANAKSVVSTSSAAPVSKSPKTKPPLDDYHSLPITPLPSYEGSDNKLSDPRERRRMQQRNNQDDNSDTDRQFIARVQENDTLNRFRRDNNLQQQSPKNVVPQLASSFDSNKDVRNPNSSARQRRRNKVHSQNTNDSQNLENDKYSEMSINSDAIQHESDNSKPEVQSSHNVEYSRSLSNESIVSEAADEEKKKESEKDVQDFLCMLTATLHLPKSSDKTSSSNSNIIDNSVAAGFAAVDLEKTYDPMLETNKLLERRDILKENCLTEISLSELELLLDIINPGDATVLKKDMINIIGEKLYEKYCAQIVTLKMYEDSLRTRRINH